MPATAENLHSARRLLREWLISARWPSDEIEQVVVAVNEAMSNAIEHAYSPLPHRLDGIAAWTCTGSSSRLRAPISKRQEHVQPGSPTPMPPRLCGERASRSSTTGCGDSVTSTCTISSDTAVGDSP
jgi:hypothetical protein